MGSSTTTTVQEADPYEPAQPLIDQGLNDLQGLYNSGGLAVTPYGGDMVADLDPLQQMAYTNAPGAYAATMGSNLQGRQGILSALDPQTNTAAMDQIRQNTINAIMPSINSSFAGSGMTGSSLHAQNLAQGLTAGIADVENQFYQQGQDRALTAAGMIGQNNANIYGSVDFLSGMGGQMQDQQQNEINAAILQDQQAQTADERAIQDYLALTTGAGSMFGVQSSTATQGGGGFGNVLGFGMQAAPFLFSDSRLKTEIKRIGETAKGFAWYSFRYIWDEPGTVREGVMAQEVEKILPDAVKWVNGYRAVNYAEVV